MHHYLFTRFTSRSIAGTPNTSTPCVGVTMPLPLPVHSSGIHQHINQEKTNPMQQPMHTVSSGNPISYAFTFALTEGETKELRCQTSEKQNPGWGMLSWRLFPLSLRGFLTHTHPANGCRQWVLRPRVQSWMCWAAHQGPHRSFGMIYTVFGERWLWWWACWALGPRKGRGGQWMLSKNYASIAFIVCLYPLSSSSIKPRSDTVFLMCRGNWGSGKWADFIQGYAYVGVY